MRTAPAMHVDAYVALGSSSTCGQGASDPASKGYVALLSRALDELFPAIETRNLGQSGGLMQDMLRRWPEVRDTRPSIITVLPFTDFAKTPIEEFSARCEELIHATSELAAERIREGGLCHTFFGDLRIDPTFVAGAKGKPEGPSYRPSDYAMLSEKNEAVQRIASKASAITLVPVIDQNAVHPEWVGAGGHPNDLGHGYIAGCFRQYIERWRKDIGGA